MYLLVAEIDRSLAPGACSSQLHEMCIALEFHKGGEEDVQAFDQVVVHRNIHHSAHLKRKISEGR